LVIYHNALARFSKAYQV